jgi:hypothetical protein
VIFSKFDMKSGFWQIQIHEMAFVTPENALSKFQSIIFSFKYSIYLVYLSLLFSPLNKISKYFTKMLFKHNVIITSELWIVSNIFIFQAKMTPPKFLSSTEEGKTKLTKFSKQWNFPPEIQNPKHLTPVRKEIAKVNKYAEGP